MGKHSLFFPFPTPACQLSGLQLRLCQGVEGGRLFFFKKEGSDKAAQRDFPDFRRKKKRRGGENRLLLASLFREKRCSTRFWRGEQASAFFWQCLFSKLPGRCDARQGGVSKKGESEAEKADADDPHFAPRPPTDPPTQYLSFREIHRLLARRRPKHQCVVGQHPLVNLGLAKREYALRSS